MRPPRVDYDGAWHHAMNRGGDGRRIFRDDRDRQQFLDLVGVAIARHDIEVHAYCLMPNHYHLLIRSQGGSLSDAMRLIGQRYTAAFNLKHERDGALFRGRFHSVLVEEPGHRDRIAHYIHANPFRDGVIQPGYPWSSHDAIVCDAPAPAWLATGVLRPTVGSTPTAPTMVDIVSAVGRVVGMRSRELFRRPRSDGAQQLVMTIARDTVGVDPDTVVKSLGFSGRHAMHCEASRARRAVRSCPELQQLRRLVESELGPITAARALR